MTTPAEKRKKTHCNKCSGRTWHDVLWADSERHDNEEDHYFWGAEYFALRCRGCDGVSFLSSSWESGVVDEDGDVLHAVQSYPPKTFRTKPHWYSTLLFESVFDEKHFLHLLDEVYIALQNNCPRLAVMGIRALLESIMIEKCGDKNSFGANLKAFEVEGYISATQRRAIEPVLEAGHAAIHRSFKPQTTEALVALDITENIVESIYVASKKAARLNVPPRKSKE